MAFEVVDGTHGMKQKYFVKIRKRAQPRIVQITWGWSIDHFTDLRELLMVIRDAINDHQTMHKHGTLHRDVSTGSILIQPLPPNSNNFDLFLSERVSKTVGQLIVLDCAKHVERKKQVPPTPVPAYDEHDVEYTRRKCPVIRNTAVSALTLVPDSRDVIYCREAIRLNVLRSPRDGQWMPTNEHAGNDVDHAKHAKENKMISPTPVPALNAKLVENIHQDLQVTESTAIHALTLIPGYSGAAYCEKVTRLNVLSSTPKGEWTPEDLGWEPVGEVPDYASQPSVVNERTGTIPFISHKLMAKNPMAVHDAIHDLESFWWVIIYLCLTRESGGGHWRQNASNKARYFADGLFHTSPWDICATKASHFGEDGAVHFTTLLELFSDYFEPLKPMLTRWRSVLVLGYNHEAYEYHLIHKYVLTIIEDTLGTLPATEETPIVRNELKRREEEYEVIYNTDCSHFRRSRLSTVVPVGFNGISHPGSEKTQVTGHVPPTRLFQ